MLIGATVADPQAAASQAYARLVGRLMRQGAS